ncbi:agarase [Pseudolabrys taiwanensis]|uniref:Agarase n=1 Tax=Pseudolabrys taiwanensis TaxID=331696 RepID=A0A345ZV32_9HYPH|nr:agarase [Pseudolabrys taiwanensis]
MLDKCVRTRWGGLADGQFRPNGFFRLAQSGGIFWLVDPDGGRFLSKGVNTVRFDQDEVRGTKRVPYADACLRRYGSEPAWRSAIAQRLTGWGFNTLGSWSDEGVAAHAQLVLTPNIDLGMSFAWQANERGGPRQEFPDVFDPAFEAHVMRRARDKCSQHSGDANIVGWFIDNELRWCPDWRGPDDLLPLFLNLSPTTPGRGAALDFLRGRYGDMAAFNAVWRTRATTWDALGALDPIEPAYRRKPPYDRNARDEIIANVADPHRAAFFADCDDFLALLAERYFTLTAAAIKAADLHHLVLGSRFAFPPPVTVIEAAARHVDVISFNCYGPDPDGALAAYAPTGKPCLIGEFSFRGADAGLPNTNGAGPVVATQTERAAAFERYATKALRHPRVVGYHWFEHADQPAEGRFDGENSNFGTVSIDDNVYETLTEAMTTLNTQAETIHASAEAIA